MNRTDELEARLHAMSALAAALAMTHADKPLLLNRLDTLAAAQRATLLHSTTSDEVLEYFDLLMEKMIAAISTGIEPTR